MNARCGGRPCYCYSDASQGRSGSGGSGDPSRLSSEYRESDTSHKTHLRHPHVSETLGQRRTGSMPVLVSFFVVQFSAFSPLFSRLGDATPASHWVCARARFRFLFRSSFSFVHSPGDALRRIAASSSCPCSFIFPM